MASSHDIDDLSPSFLVLRRLCSAAASRNHNRLTRKWSRRGRPSVGLLGRGARLICHVRPLRNGSPRSLGPIGVMYMAGVYCDCGLPSLSLLPDVEGFQWDDGNAAKNWTRHQVSQTEAEQVFLNRPIVVAAAPFEEGIRTIRVRAHRRRAATHGSLHCAGFAVTRDFGEAHESGRERRGYGQASDS